MSSSIFTNFFSANKSIFFGDQKIGGIKNIFAKNPRQKSRIFFFGIINQKTINPLFVQNRPYLFKTICIIIFRYFHYVLFHCVIFPALISTESAGRNPANVFFVRIE